VNRNKFGIAAIGLAVWFSAMAVDSVVFEGRHTLSAALADKDDFESSGDSYDRRPTNVSSQFPASGTLRNQVEFWKLIFTKYGKDQAVFHHRQYPQVVYSVLDFSDLKSQAAGGKLDRLKNDAIEEETSRIRIALNSLADGNSPTNAFERRIEKLFSALPGDKSRLYADAADTEQIRSQTGVRERFREGLIRSGRYLPAMERIFRGEGLPPELTRLPLIESSFDYTAYSSVGAAGIWQFMRSTGKKEMRIDSYIDERRDPILATRAAARYLDHAYDALGAWPLAVTSYNHGVTGVARAVKAVGSTDMNKIIAEYKAESFGFASKNFYAEFVAAVEVEREKKRYFPGIEVEQPWGFVEVRLARQMGISDLSRASGVEKDELLRLNTAFLPPVINGRGKIPAKFLVKLPPRRYGTELASLGEVIRSEQAAQMELAGRKIYGSFELQQSKVQSGKSVSVASKSKQSKAQSVIPSEKSGTVTPVKSSRQSSTNLPAAKSSESPIKEQVAKKTEKAVGKSGAKVAKSGNAAASERTLAKRTGREKGAVRRTYAVKSGDTLSGIAKTSGIKVSKLRQLNPGAGAKLKPGQKIYLE
jgi:membrane-bound lytic murein transglycosylase D